MPASGEEPSPDLVDALVQSAMTVTALLTRVAARHDLSLTQLRVIGILRDREPRMAEMAAFLGLERSTVSGLIDRAVRRGLVLRDLSAEDGRGVRVRLSAPGRHLAGLIGAEITGQLAPLISRLGAADRARLTTLLARSLEQS